MRRTFLRRLVPALVAPFVVLLDATGAFAATGHNLPWETPLQNLEDVLSGPTAKVISIIAIVIAGAALVFGEDLGQFARRLMLVVLAVALIVGAASFLTNIGFAPGASF